MKTLNPYARAISMLATLMIGSAAVAADLDSSLPECGNDTGPVISSVKVALPAVGAPNEVEVGQSIVSQMMLDTHIQSVTLTSESTFAGRYGLQAVRGTVAPGTLVRGHMSYWKPTNSNIYFGNSSKANTWPHPFVEISIDSADPLEIKAMIFFADNDPGKGYPLESPAVKVTRCAMASKASFRRELIYTGVAKGAVSLQYREFKDDYARPAFSQELHYDLAEGDEIGFRGARIKILKATNASVKYVVLKPLE